MKVLATVLLWICLQSPSQATLINRGDGLIYDDVLDVTWLQDANYAKTSGYDADGLMEWTQAMEWVGQLVYAGFDDWRLPGLKPINGDSYSYTFGFDGGSDEGYNIASPVSELAYMHYVNLKGVGYYDVDGNRQTDLAGSSNVAWDGIADAKLSDFTIYNVAPYYWFGNDDYEGLPAYAWVFRFDFGQQLIDKKYFSHHAWAVRDGDVVAVPVPNSLWLFLSAIIFIHLSTKKTDRDKRSQASLAATRSLYTVALDTP